MKPANLRVLLLCLGATSIAATAAAQIAGKLVLGAYKPAAPEVEHAAFNWELENGFKEVRPDRVDARREITAVLLGEGEPLPGTDRVEVAFSGGALLPSTIAVRAGATVLVRNDDEIAHELYAVGLDGFSAEATSPRGRRSVNVTKPGNWPLRDKLVSHVGGHLHVLPNLIAATAPDAEGGFSFQAPPGKYVLKVLHGERELLSKEVELTGKELTLEPITLTDSPESK
jgi:hypothetical protein